MSEIGGYFGLEKLISRERYPNLVAVNNARNALLYLLKAKRINKLYLPYLLCESVSRLCDREACEYEFYTILPDFTPDFNRVLGEREYLYVVNYYGQISNTKIQEIQKVYKNVIFDNVQAFFQPPIEGIDTIYSCRKFFGVPDGAYLATDTLLEEQMEADVSKDRMKHILGRFEGEASEYYQDFKENDQSFGTLPLRQMSALTHNLLGAIDYAEVCARRNANYAFLAKALDNHNQLKLIVPEGPYAYPFYCKNGMELKRRLAEKKIYVATLWPNVLSCENVLERDYAENILPLPCDQRYDASDMMRIIDEIHALW